MRTTHSHFSKIIFIKTVNSTFKNVQYVHVIVKDVITENTLSQSYLKNIQIKDSFISWIWLQQQEV